MSALLHVPTPRRSGPETGPGRLRAVSTPAGRLARVPFLLVLAATLGLGMVGLLVLNTTVQTDAVEVRALEARLTTLSYTEAELETQLDRAESPADLAEKASDLGLRPNPYPAFIDLETGEVSGDPREVEGDEMSALVTRSAAQVARDDAAAEQRAAERRAAEQQAAREQAAQEKKEQAAQEKKEQAAREKKEQAAQEKKEQAAREKKQQQEKKEQDQQQEKEQGQDD